MRSFLITVIRDVDVRSIVESSRIRPSDHLSANIVTHTGLGRQNAHLMCPKRWENPRHPDVRVRAGDEAPAIARKDGLFKGRRELILGGNQLQKSVCALSKRATNQINSTVQDAGLSSLGDDLSQEVERSQFLLGKRNVRGSI